MAERRQLKAGMVGIGMIFDETYRPFFERAHRDGLHGRAFGDLDVPLVGVASRTGRRAEAYKQAAADRVAPFESFVGDDAVDRLIPKRRDNSARVMPESELSGLEKPELNRYPAAA